MQLESDLPSGGAGVDGFSTAASGGGDGGDPASRPAPPGWRARLRGREAHCAAAALGGVALLCAIYLLSGSATPAPGAGATSTQTSGPQHIYIVRHGDKYSSCERPHLSKRKEKEFSE